MEVALAPHQFLQHILRMIHKNANCNILGFTRDQLEQFYRDLSFIYTDLRTESQQAVVQTIAVIQKWWSALEEILGVSLNVVTRFLAQDASLRRQILSKLLPIIRSVGTGLQVLAIVVDFGINLYNIVQISGRIKEALKIIKDEEIGDKFGRLENYIGRMKALSDSIDKIIGPFKNDLRKGMTDNWTLPKLEKLLEQLNQKLDLVDRKEYQANVDMINDLRERISRQYRVLQANAEHLRKTAVGSGVGAGFSAGLGIVGRCARIIPVIGPIISVASISISAVGAITSGIVCGLSIAERQAALSRLASAQDNLNQLGRYEGQLQRTMRHIEELERFKEQLAKTIEHIRNDESRRGLRGLLMNFWNQMQGFFW